MICSNCGADIGDNETACPYCGAMQYENSEQKYMKDLYNLNEGMEKLDKNTRKYIIKSTMKSVGIVCAAIAAAVLAGSMFGYGSYKSMYNSSHNRKEIHQSLDWYNNNIGELNSLYEKRDYAGISELTDSYKGSSSVLEKWSHYNFINIYDYYYKRVADIYIMVHKGCTAEEKETVDGWVAEAQSYLKNVAKATDKEINDMLNELYQNGYYDYKLGKSYEESFYKKYNEGGNN